MASRLAFACPTLLAAVVVGGVVNGQSATPAQPQLGTRTVKVLEIDGLRFKDLNKNGRLDAYEDWRQPVDVRVADLVSQMTLSSRCTSIVPTWCRNSPRGPRRSSRTSA